MRQVVDHWGRVDVLVNNAGGGLSDTIEMPVDTWNQSLQFNLGVMFLTTRAAWPTMVAQESGVVLSLYKYLASEEARWVNGSTFVIDGGTSISAA